MIINNFEIVEVRLNKIDSKANLAQFKVTCSDDSNPVTLELSLAPGLDYCAKELIQKVKRARKKEDTEVAGPLANLSIVNILNDEEVVDAVHKGLIRVDNKVTSLKKIRIASEYMKLFDQVNTMQETLYRKKVVQTEY